MGEPRRAADARDGAADRSGYAVLTHELHRLRRTAQRLERLDRFEDEVEGIEGKQSLFERTAGCMRELFDVQRASVTLVNAGGTTFDVFALDQEAAGVVLVRTAMPLATTAVGAVIEARRVINSPDISGSDYEDYRMLYEAGIRSILHAPLVVGGHPIGCVNMGAARPAAFDAEDEVILVRLIRTITRRLEHRRLVSELRSAARAKQEAAAVVERLRHLGELAHALKTALTEGEVLAVLARGLESVVPFERGQVTLSERGPQAIHAFSLRPGQAIRQESGDNPSQVFDADFRSVIEAGLFVGEAEIGRVRLCHANLERYDDRDFQLLHQITSLVAAALHAISLIETAREAQAAAEASSAAKSSFVASVSHELRTPLNAIIGMTSLLSGMELSEVPRRYVETIRGSSEVLRAVISDVLDFSKIEADGVELQEQPFELPGCVQGVVDLFASAAEEKGLRLRCEIDPSLPREVKGDEARLRQVLVNLVGNAMKFTAAGKVDVWVSKREGVAIIDEVEIEVVVADTGIGMSPEHLATLFEPFARADASLSRRHGGTGLGLTIARRLIELMGGRIWAHSQPGQGSRFHFTVGLRRSQRPMPTVQASAPLVAPTDPSLADSYPLHILVAEDNKVNQFVMLSILEHLGYRADVVTDGHEALEALEREPYDVILMDVQMPRVDGLTATTRIRQGEGNRELPQIIAVTANATPEDQRACLQAGMDDFLSKPVLLEELAVALVCASRRMATARV